MTLDEFDIITDKLVGITKYVYLHVMGEPLSHPELARMISMAASKGFLCAITTNGTLLGNRSKELLNSEVYKVSISLHSFEGESEDAFCNYVNGCIDFADKAASRGILCVLRLWNKGFDGGRNERVLSLLKDRFSQTWKWSVRGARIKDKLHLEYGERFSWPSLDAADMGDDVFCYGLKDQFGILSDGSIVPCCLDGDGVITLGNAFTDGITEVLQSPRAVAMREGFKCRRATEELCRKCGYARRFK